jgi:hypothetical protein
MDFWIDKKGRIRTSFGGEVNPAVPSRNILRNVKNPNSMKETSIEKFADISGQVSLALFLGVSVDYCQRTSVG